MVNVNWPTAVAGEADIVSSASASACKIGGPIGVNPGELTLVYGHGTVTRIFMKELLQKEIGPPPKPSMEIWSYIVGATRRN